MPIIQDLIDVGVDVLNPLQPLAVGIDPGGISNLYDEKLPFHDAIDIQVTLPGTIGDVREEVKTKIK